MKKIQIHQYYSAVIVLALILVSPSKAENYVIKEGDTFSNITHRFLGERVYGKNGNLKKLQALNPTIKNPNIISVGKIILLPSKEPFPEEAPPLLVNQPVDIDNTKETPSSINHSLMVKTSFSFNELQGSALSNQSKAALYSNLSPKIILNWTTHWSDSFSTYLEGGFEKMNFESTSERKIKNVASYNELAIGGSYWISKFIFIGLSYGVEEMPFYYASSLDELTISKLPIEAFRMSVGSTLLKISKSELRVQAKYGILQSKKNSIFSVKAGASYGATMSLQHQINPFINLDGDVFFERSEQKTNIVTQTITSKGIGLTVRVNF